MYVEGLKELMYYDTTSFQYFGEDSTISLESTIAIRNELANDGLIYATKVKPIFTEAIGNSISFFESWGENYKTINDFKEGLPVIQRKVRKLT